MEGSASPDDAILRNALAGAGVQYEMLAHGGASYARFTYGPKRETSLLMSVSYKPFGMRIVVHGVLPAIQQDDVLPHVNELNRHWGMARAFYEPVEPAVVTALTLFAYEPPSRDVMRAAIHYLYKASLSLRAGEVPEIFASKSPEAPTLEKLGEILKSLGFAYTRIDDGLRLAFVVKGGTDFVAVLRVIDESLIHMSASPGDAGLVRDDLVLKRLNDINRKLVTGAVSLWEGQRAIFTHAVPFEWLVGTEWSTNPGFFRHMFDVASFACADIAGAVPR